jgi:uncharacterized membrane-anchored protein
MILEASTAADAGLPPADHPDRRLLSDEVHARPSEALQSPMRASHIALVIDADQRPREIAHLTALCNSSGVPPPAFDATHFTADLQGVRLKWERHGEFSSYTFFAAGLESSPFAEPAVNGLSADWVARLPGETLVAAHATLLATSARDPDAAHLRSLFDGNGVIGGGVGGGTGMAFADFKIHTDRFSRFLVLNTHFTRRQAGRMVQRLFEIETYRMMAMLALPLAREQSRAISGVERSLAALTDDIAGHSVADETLLQQLTNLAADVERCLVRSQFRFGACKAYHDLVMRRIAELREQKLTGFQTIEEFMVRRFTPAAATCASTSQRLHDLSERVAQASALLSTRVDIVRERQNHKLLDSMNRRARLQLRLQQTVEIISVIPITYYVVALVGYVSRALQAAGSAIEPEIVEGVAIPIVAGLVIWVVRRAHHRIAGESKGMDVLDS